MGFGFLCGSHYWKYLAVFEWDCCISIRKRYRTLGAIILSTDFSAVSLLVCLGVEIA
jgi:hypothetical protein